LLLQLQSNGTIDIISPWGSFNNSLPVTVSLPFTVYLPFTISLLLPLPFPLPVLCSHPCPGPFLTALGALLTLAVVIVIAIATTAPSTAGLSGSHPVVIITILVDYLIPIQWSKGQEVSWCVLPAAWRLNLCLEIIATVPRETLTGAFTLPPTSVSNGSSFGPGG
jgi:hypothetical protein